MTLNEIHDELATLRAAILEGCTLHPATALSLDARCGPLHVNEEYLVTDNRRSLDYYGGFEYIEPEYVIQVGDLTLYSTEHDRVLTALQTLEFNHD